MKNPMIEKRIFELSPIEKKWCDQTLRFGTILDFSVRHKNWPSQILLTDIFVVFQPFSNPRGEGAKEVPLRALPKSLEALLTFKFFIFHFK